MTINYDLNKYLKNVTIRIDFVENWFWCSYEEIWKSYLKHDIVYESCFLEKYFREWLEFFQYVWGVWDESNYYCHQFALKIKSVCNSRVEIGHMFMSIFLNHIGFTDFFYMEMLISLLSFSSRNAVSQTFWLKRYAVYSKKL